MRTVKISLAAALLAFAGALLAAPDSVTIPFPGRGVSAVNLTTGPMVVRSVTLKHRPSRREVRHARRDADDTKTLWWRFALGNGGRRDRKARIHVQVLAEDGRLLADDSRSGDVDARDRRDHITVWTKIRTRDYPSARFAKISVDSRAD
jgi:hypothetical protein